MGVGAVKGSHDSEERAMQTITTIGLDIAKSVFQVHGVDTGGQVVIRRQLKRRYVLAFFQKVQRDVSQQNHEKQKPHHASPLAEK
jgi:hypothetical protein